MAVNNLDFIVKNGLVVNNTATILDTTNSISTDTGALQVSGGVGIAKDLYVGDNIKVNFDGDSITGGAIVAKAGNNISAIYGYAQSSSTVKWGVTGESYATGVNSAGIRGLIDHVTDTAIGYVGFYDGSSYFGFYTPDKTKIGGVLSVTNNTNASSTTTGALVVTGGAGIGGNLYVGGEIVAEKLTIQFTTVTTTLIQTDDVIQTLNSTDATSTTTGALKVTGGAGFGGNIHVGGSITSKDNVYSSNSASISTTSTTSIDTFDKTVYRLSKYIIQVTQSTSYQASEILILHNGSEAFITEYGVVRSNSNLANFSTDIDGNNVRLLVNMISATAATIKMNRISILV